MNIFKQRHASYWRNVGSVAEQFHVQGYWDRVNTRKRAANLQLSNNPMSNPIFQTRLHNFIFEHTTHCQ
jgi:hypothetical protein